MMSQPETTRPLRESNALSRFFLLALLVAVALLLALVPPLWSALGLAALIFVTLIVVRPHWALYLLPFAVPFGSIREVELGVATMGGTEAILGLFLLTWVLRGLAFRDLSLRRPPIWGAIAIWFSTMVLSLLTVNSLPMSIKELIKWGETFLLLAIVSQEIDRRGAAILLATTFLAASIAALEGIYQAIFQVGPTGFLFPLGGRLWLRAYGRFIQPNPFAGYLGLVLPLGYSLIVAGLLRRWREPFSSPIPWGWTLLVLLTTLLTAVTLFLTLSRGAWFGAAAAFVVVIMLFSQRLPTVVAVGGSLMLLFLAFDGISYLPPALAQRLTDFVPYINVLDIDVRGVAVTAENFAVIERLAHWQAGYSMWVDSPWLGQGVGNYAAAYERFYIHPWDEPLGHAHNLFLNTLAETGIIGLFGYLIFWVSAFGLALQAVRRTAGLWRGVAIGIVGALVHLHVHNFFDNLFVHGMYLHVALLLGIAAMLRRPHQPTGSAA